MVEAPEESGGDGLLPLGRRIGIIKGFEEGPQGRSQVGAVLDVKGTWFEMVPKRRSQDACGTPQSADAHWLLTLSVKFTLFSPLSVAICVEEGSENDFFLIVSG